MSPRPLNFIELLNTFCRIGQRNVQPRRFKLLLNYPSDPLLQNLFYIIELTFFLCMNFAFYLLLVIFHRFLFLLWLCTKLCDQKWPKSNAFYLAFIFISNGPVSEKRDFLEKLKGAVSRVSSFHAKYNYILYKYFKKIYKF